MHPGTSLPKPFQQALQLEKTRVIQATVSVLPQHTLSDVCVLQQADPIIQEVLVFWTQKQHSSYEKQKQLSQSTLILLWQWDHLVKRSGVTYHQGFHPDSMEEMFQLLLPAALTKKVLT